MKHLRIAAFASGSGSNLQSILDAIESKELDAEITVVIASRPNIPVLERAKKYGIPSVVIPRKQFAENIDAFSSAIEKVLIPYDIDVIVLCGFLSFLSASFCRNYRNRILNIHPSLLPAFGGQGAYGTKVHRMALAHGVKISGCTVMFVDEGKDTGPIIIQKAVPVLEDDTEDTLAERVMSAEKVAYPEALRLFGENRLQVLGDRVRILRKD